MLLWAVWSTDREKQKKQISELPEECGEGLLIKKGEIVKKVKEEELLETLRQELLHWKVSKPFFEVFPTLKAEEDIRDDVSGCGGDESFDQF